MAAIGRLILAADVVRYSSLIGADEEGTLERLEAHCHQLVYPKIAKHCGHIVRAAGDSLLVEFASPTEAVQCAVEVQRGMIDRNIGTAPDRRITFRVGIHIGEVTVIGDDLISRAVAALPIDRLATLIKPGGEINDDASNIAMRVAALADPGGMCISSTVRDPIRDQLPYTFEYIGEQNLDIRTAPVHCYAMSADSVAARPGIAQNQRGTASQGDVSPPAIGISSPPLRTTFQQVVLTAAIVSTIAIWIAGGWAFLASFHHPPPKLAASVANKPAAVAKPAEPARPELVATDNPPTPSEPSPSEPQSPPNRAAVIPTVVSANKPSPVGDDEELVDPAARELIMQGWSLYHLPYTPVRWQEARSDFERALELDSRASGARIGLAAILSTKLADGWSPVLQEDIPRAEQLLIEALDRGGVSNQAAARFTLGVLRQMQTRLPDAQKEFEIAISLDPNNAPAYFHLGETLLYLGEPEAGIQALEKAIQLDPNIAVAYWTLGTSQLFLGRVDQAIDLLQTARPANDHRWVPYFYLAGAYGLKGDLDKAKAALAESLEWKPAIKSLARMRAENPWLSNPQYWEMQEKTLNLGLRRVGFPDQ
jgi:class 3 adenylate cyclase